MSCLYVSSSKPFSCLADDFHFTRYPLYAEFTKPSLLLWFRFAKETNSPPLWLRFGYFDDSALASLTSYIFRSKRFGSALVRKIKKTGRNYLFTPVGVYTLYLDYGPCFVRNLPSSWTKFDWDFFSKSDLKALSEIGYARSSL